MTDGLVRVPVPASLRRSAENPPATPAEPRDAATIVVVRDGAAGIEAYLMRRQTTMAFAAGFYVFPGGGVAPADYDDVPWVGPGADVWAERWRCAPDRARALVVAAVRETFEETGILLAGPDEHSVLEDTTDLEPVRTALEEREVTFGEVLRARGLMLRSDLVGAWAHWITPAFEPRRYDTHFFVAALPSGQQVGVMSREADRASWRRLRDVLGEIERGEASMMPPTIAACREVAAHTADRIVADAAGRTFPTIVPRLVRDGDDVLLETYLGGES